jgi:hypothetical protein
MRSPRRWRCREAGPPNVAAWLSLLFAGSLLGCGAPAETTLGTDTSAIVGGFESLDDDAVVMLRTTFKPGTPEMLCTATLLASNVVLTSYRCLAPLPTAAFSCRPDGSVAPLDGGGGGWFGEPVPSDTEIHLGPRAARTDAAALGARIWGAGTLEACIDDIALLELDRDLQLSPVAPGLSRAIAFGDAVSVVGFGDSGASNYPFVRFRRDDLKVTAVGPDDTSEGVSSVTPRTFWTDDGLCTGDTGGPALAADTGAVVGVYSRPTYNTSCYATGQSHIFTKVAPYASLIREALDAVGSEPLPETTAEVAAPPAHSPPAHSGCGVSPRVSNLGGTAEQAGVLALVALVLGRLDARRRSRAATVSDAGR